MKKAKEVYERFGTVNTLEDFKPRWNIRPRQMNPVVTNYGLNRISRMLWGLIPYFAEDKNSKYKTINAKAETVDKLLSFREPLRRKRCLIPATGFYEPDKVHFSKPPYPWHYFQLKAGQIFAFAGLYDIWKDKNTNKEIYSYAIITTAANSIVGKIHDRMPAVLEKKDEETWLNSDITEAERLLPLLKSYPARKMEGWQVEDAARNPRNDYAELLRPIGKKVN